MTQAKFCLSCDAYKSNIHSGLSLLQQNGEFVDMTLAADGHLVKVHQVVMALASPYIKELISAANCPHPVIFLSKISYKVLCSVLEYIYTGEVLVSKEDINDVILACKELHISGLEHVTLSPTAPTIATNQKLIQGTLSMAKEHTNVTSTEDNYDDDMDQSVDIPDDDFADASQEDRVDTFEIKEVDESIPKSNNTSKEAISEAAAKVSEAGKLQYTLSTHGRCQLILNRFMYSLNHMTQHRNRHWRCLENKTQYKCPAFVYTQGDVLVRRAGVHNHPFHDKKILDKVRLGLVYTSMGVAEERSKQKIIENLSGKQIA